MKLTRDHQLILGAAFIGCLGVFGMHVLLPALPAIGRRLQVDAAATQLLISLSMLAIGLGNLVVAPISDRLGRRRVVLAAIGLYVGGSVAGLFAPTLGTLVAARILQAFGGGAAQAVVRAMLSDRFGPGAASPMAYTAMGVLVVPMIAPTLGGVAVETAGWRAPFGLAAVFGAIVLVFAVLRVAETHQGSAEQRASGPRMLDSYRQLLRTREYVGFVLYGGFMMSTVYTFIAVAPYVAIEIYGVSPPEYGLWFAVPAAASFVGFMLAGRISRAKGNYWMMRAGASVSLAGAVAILACVAAGLWSPAALFLPAMLICHANALSAPNSTAAAIMVRPDIAGAASGLLGFLQLAIAAAFAQTVAMLEDGTPWPPALAILAANALALASYQWIRRHRDARIAAAHDATVAAEATRESST